MSIVSTDIKFYGSANMQETDSGTQGGAIDTTTRVVFTDLVTAGVIEVLSDNGADTTQTVTIYGRLATGVLTSEALALNGASVVAGAISFERILKIVVNNAHAGTITVRRGADDAAIASIETGVLTIRRPFYNVSADASGGSARNFYEKIFVKNTHATLSLLGAAFVEYSDGTEAVSADVTFDLEDAVDDNNTSTDRVTAPSGMLGTFTDASKNCPGTDLAAGSAIGVWLKLNLPAGTAAQNTTFGLNTSGSST